jgi:hypothetical protein
MFPYRVAWAPGLLAVMMAAASGADLSAAETPTEKALAKLGLKQAGPLLVLDAESEVHSKTTEARQLFREWSNAVMQQRSTVSEKEYQATIKELTAETNSLRNELNNTNRMINQVPMNRGRFATNLGAQQSYELNMYRSQLQWELDQRATFLSQLKSQPFDPKAKLKIDADVRDKAEALHKSVLDLRKLVDETGEKYKGLDKNDEVKKLLISIERKTGAKVKLGQSRPFHLDVKYLEKLEQQVSTGESAGSTEKPARKGRRSSTKAKRSSRPSTDSEDLGSPF